MECPHILNLQDLSLGQGLNSTKIGIQCWVCQRGRGESVGAQLWLCLNASCLHVVCSDHSLFHFEVEPTHCLQVNLGTFRVWCYRCDGEVVVVNPSPPEPPPTDSKPKGLTGLQNVGNTCYMNAALQALSNSPPLLAHFLSAPVPPAPPLTSAFHRLLLDIWSPRRYPWVAPTSVLYGIRNSHPMFRGFHQHDTQEFLRCLMDQLHEEMKRPSLEHKPPVLEQDAHSSEGEEYETCDSGVSERSSLSEEPTANQPPPLSRTPSPTDELRRLNINPPTLLPQHVSSPYRKKQQLSYRSIVSDVFDGKLISSVQCLTCNRVSTRVETFQDLSLPIPSRDHIALLHHGTINPNCSHLYNSEQEGWWWWLWEWVCSWFWGPTVGLHDCLAAFFSADDLKGDNMYSCDKCSKLRNGVKYSRVLECPEVLCIHLKRFRHEVMFSSKINSHVAFPLQGLDLAPYLDTNCPSEVTKYELSSVICHHGTVGGGGHYICYALNTESDKWYEFDDQNVRQVSSDTVASSEAYVLFYRKDCTVVNRLRRKAMRLEDMTRNSGGGGDSKRWLVSRDWVERFNSWGEPGPIDNRAILCAHGGLLPTSPQPIVVPHSIWSFIYPKFGGGPALRADYLKICKQCSDGETSLLRVQWHEFQRLGRWHDGGRMAISCKWLENWEAHVLNSRPSPGPIDNSSISQPNQGDDYCELTSGQWELLVRLYGGGPPLRVTKDLPRADRTQDDNPEWLQHPQDNANGGSADEDDPTKEDGGGDRKEDASDAQPQPQPPSST